MEQALIDSFQCKFWIDEHQSFVRCFPSENSIHLYTLSQTFHYGDQHIHMALNKIFIEM